MGKNLLIQDYSLDSWVYSETIIVTKFRRLADDGFDTKGYNDPLELHNLVWCYFSEVGKNGKLGQIVSLKPLKINF